MGAPPFAYIPIITVCVENGNHTAEKYLNFIKYKPRSVKISASGLILRCGG
jgi:hypothetical protein